MENKSSDCIFIKYDSLNKSYGDIVHNKIDKYNINNNELDGFPKREELVEKFNGSVAKKIDFDIRTGQPFYFMPTDVNESTEYVDGVGRYVLQLFGCAVSGDKVQVTLMDILPSFDVLCPKNLDPIDFERKLRILLESKDTNLAKIEDKYGFPLFGYQEKKSLFKRLYFYDMWSRTKAIDKISRTDNIELFSDDTYGYVKKLARERELSLSSWMEVKSYTIRNDGSNCKYSIQVSIDNVATITNNDILKSEEMKKDKTMVLTWDAETYTPERTGVIPIAERDGDEFIEICGTVHWKNDNYPLLQFCIITERTPVNPDPRWITVMCKTQNDLIKAFAHVLRALKPDIITGYNDCDYDWKFYLGKAEQRGLLEYVARTISAVPLSKKLDEKDVKKKYIKSDQKIKITAETTYLATYLKVPGLLPVDSCIIYAKLFPRMDSSRKQSLNYYLKLVGLQGKVEVSIQDMFRLVEEKDDTTDRRERTKLYVLYCVTDALRTQQLMLKSNVIDENRDISSYSYVTLYDSFYYAGGMKVVNLLAKYANKMEIMMPMVVRTKREKGKYSGAWVGTPKKGLYKKRPVTGLDAGSLYPSIIRAYNLSPEKYLGERHIEFKDITDKYKYTNVKTVYNGREFIGSFIRHENDKSRTGLFPTVLGDLFARRKLMKAELKPLKSKKEKTEAKGLSNLTEAEIKEYENLLFDIQYLDSKQKAAKVYMNTFYGEAGNALSPVYLLQLASGVTQYGQLTIKFAYKFVQSKGFEVVYGDTDSLYLIAPDKYYIDCDERYAKKITTKREYWEEMVSITMKAIGQLRDDLNAALAEDNGTNIINMEYEEVLFPVAIVAKKKYWGIPHIGIPNFNTEELFIRGIDTIKTGQTEYIKTIGKKIMWDAVSPNNDKNLIDIVKDTLRWAILEANWKFKDFVEYLSYKPNKNNPVVQKFVARMKNKHEKECIENEISLKKSGVPIEFLYTPPEGGEKFKCVVVQQQSIYNLKGLKESSKKGDIMEYAAVAERLNLPINIEYYIKKKVLGMCARFISYDQKYVSSEEKRLHEEGKLELCTKEELKKFDDHTIKTARKDLEVFVDNIKPNKKATIEYGKICKRSYKNMIGDLNMKQLNPFAKSTELSYEWFSDDSKKIEDITHIVFNMAYNVAHTNINNEFTSYMEIFCERNKISKDNPTALYNIAKKYDLSDIKSYGRIKMRSFDKIETTIKYNLTILIVNISKLCIQYETMLIDLIEEYRKVNGQSDIKIDSHTENKIKDIANDKNFIEFNEEWNKLCAIIMLKTSYKKINDELIRMKNETQKFIPLPTAPDIQQMIKQDIQMINSSH
jgi:DNA polymerase elongation subunit (family B)